MSARLLDNGIRNLFASVSGIGNEHAARPVDPLIAPCIADLVTLGAVPDHRRLSTHRARLEAVQVLEQRYRFGHGQRCYNAAMTRLNLLDSLWNKRKLSCHWFGSVLRS